MTASARRFRWTGSRTAHSAGSADYGQGSHPARRTPGSPPLRFKTLSEQGMWVSTGKLVWFRNRDLLSDTEKPGSHPLYWSDNQRGMTTVHPVKCDKGQWVTDKADSRNMVLPSGSYCLVNRFSAKEQRHRVYASYLRSDTEYVADNKLNYVHQGTSRRTAVPLNDKVAWGLTLWLTSSIVDGDGTARYRAARRSMPLTYASCRARRRDSLRSYPTCCP